MTKTFRTYRTAEALARELRAEQRLANEERAHAYKQDCLGCMRAGIPEPAPPVISAWSPIDMLIAFTLAQDALDEMNKLTLPLGLRTKLTLSWEPSDAACDSGGNSAAQDDQGQPPDEDD